MTPLLSAVNPISALVCTFSTATTRVADIAIASSKDLLVGKDSGLPHFGDSMVLERSLFGPKERVWYREAQGRGSDAGFEEEQHHSLSHLSDEMGHPPCGMAVYAVYALLG